MEENQIIISGLKISCKSFGKGPLVLVLHGWGVGSRAWVEVGELMARDGFEVIVPDLPGFGQSQEPKFAWGVDDYLEFVEQFVGKMKFEKFFLVGHSFGGVLAAKFAAIHPEIVGKLVLCDAAIIRRERLDWKQTYVKKMASWKNRLLELPFTEGVYPLAKKILYKFAGSRDYELASPTMKEIFKNVIKVDILEYTRKISVPTLIVWGDKDKSTPVEDAYEINRAIAGSRLAIIPGAGHKLHRTHSKKLAEIISTFITE